MTKELMIVSVPNTHGRYYLLPTLDMWTDVFASPGWRTTGTSVGNFLIAPPSWRVMVPVGMTRIDAPIVLRLMALRIATRFIKSRPDTSSRRYRNGAILLCRRQ